MEQVLTDRFNANHGEGALALVAAIQSNHIELVQNTTGEQFSQEFKKYCVALAASLQRGRVLHILLDENQYPVDALHDWVGLRETEKNYWNYQGYQQPLVDTKIPKITSLWDLLFKHQISLDNEYVPTLSTYLTTEDQSILSINRQLEFVQEAVKTNNVPMLDFLVRSLKCKLAPPHYDWKKDQTYVWTEHEVSSHGNVCSGDKPTYPGSPYYDIYHERSTIHKPEEHTSYTHALLEAAEKEKVAVLEWLFTNLSLIYFKKSDYGRCLEMAITRPNLSSVLAKYQPVILNHFYSQMESYLRGLTKETILDGLQHQRIYDYTPEELHIFISCLPFNELVIAVQQSLTNKGLEKTANFLPYLGKHEEVILRAAPLELGCLYANISLVTQGVHNIGYDSSRTNQQEIGQLKALLQEKQQDVSSYKNALLQTIIEKEHIKLLNELFLQPKVLSESELKSWMLQAAKDDKVNVVKIIFDVAADKCWVELARLSDAKARPKLYALVSGLVIQHVAQGSNGAERTLNTFGFFTAPVKASVTNEMDVDQPEQSFRY